MNQDVENLNLLSIFYYVFAAVTALGALFPLIHLVVGLLMMFGGVAFPEAKGLPIFFGGFFVFIAIIIMVTSAIIAVLMYFAGRSLKRHENYTFCLIVAAVSCTMFPLGTALGVCTILLLMKDPVKELFGQPTSGAGMYQSH